MYKYGDYLTLQAWANGPSRERYTLDNDE